MRIYCFFFFPKVMDDLEEITVTSPREKEPYVIPLDSEGKLSLFTLKEYFPYANGLVYSRDGKKTALSIRENHLIINPVVREYEVNIANTGTYNNILCSQFLLSQNFIKIQLQLVSIVLNLLNNVYVIIFQVILLLKFSICEKKNCKLFCIFFSL